MLEEKNVRFYMKNGVAEIQGENGKVRRHTWKTKHFWCAGICFFFFVYFCHDMFHFQVKQVILHNGEVLQTDVVIAGIGKYQKI